MKYLIAFLIDYFLFESKGQNSNDEKDLFLLSSLDDSFTCIICKGDRFGCAFYLKL